MLKKKVLILCYDFPPLNTVGALRPNSWYQELHKYNIYPIVITRNWSAEIKNSAEKFSDIETKSEIYETDNGTIIKSEYKPNLKSRLIAKYGFKKYSFLRKFLTIRDLFLGPFFNSFDEYHFIYKEAYKYLSENKVDLIIATGSPFGLFKQAHLLSEKFSTKWMADYRDPFTSNISIEKTKFQKLNERFKRYLENKWTENIIHFTSVSDPFVKSISTTISKKGTAIRNGFDSRLILDQNHEKRKQFIVTYIGTIYESAYIDILEDGIKIFLNSEKTANEVVKFKFVGIGLNHTSGTDRILKLKNRFPENIEIVPSCSNKEALSVSANSNVLLNLNYNSSASGIIPVKLYEYLALKKSIINIEMRNSDEKGEFDDYLNNISNKEDFYNCLIELYNNWELDKEVQNIVPEKFLSQFTRSHQTKLLAELINRLV